MGLKHLFGWGIKAENKAATACGSASAPVTPSPPLRQRLRLRDSPPPVAAPAAGDKQ